MTQTAIPFLLLRGGTSRGPFILRHHLPEDLQSLAEVLLAVVGSGHPSNVDGVGGGAAVTTKVAMLSRSNDPDADVDYFFAQVSVADRLVDFKPTCGNMLAGVGPAAIELGLVEPAGEATEIRIHAVNTGARVTALVSTREGAADYEGDTVIDGVPGSAAPVSLMFHNVAGSVSGQVFPTGQRAEVINDVPVTCIDVAMPMVIARAGDLGVTGSETPDELDANASFMARIETIRIIAGQRMGLGDVTDSVVPKFGLLAPPRHGGTAGARYFMPWNCHPTLAVTGSQCLAACLLEEGTVGDGLAAPRPASPARIRLEHPAGSIEVVMTFERAEEALVLRSAGLVRTARKIAAGHVFIPRSIWTGT